MFTGHLGSLSFKVIYNKRKTNSLVVALKDTLTVKQQRYMLVL